MQKQPDSHLKCAAKNPINLQFDYFDSISIKDELPGHDHKRVTENGSDKKCTKQSNVEYMEISKQNVNLTNPLAYGKNLIIRFYL